MHLLDRGGGADGDGDVVKIAQWILFALLLLAVLVWWLTGPVAVS